MLGRIFIALAGGLVVWKYRDSLREYLGGNAGPARARLDDLLQTVQEKSEVLLDQAKEQLSSRIGSAPALSGGVFWIASTPVACPDSGCRGPEAPEAIV